jgi:IS30 family transposase
VLHLKYQYNSLIHIHLGRGSNENTNGLLRQYMPKGTDLTIYNSKDLLKIEASLNGRPRKTLNYIMPKEKLAELVALST